MLSIGADGAFVEVIVFRTERGQQDPLVDAIARETERWVRERPGFLATAWHKSEDGTRVLHYAKWRSRADWDAFIVDPESEGLGRRIRAVGLATPGDARAYRVVGLATAASLDGA